MTFCHGMLKELTVHPGKSWALLENTATLSIVIVPYKFLNKILNQHCQNFVIYISVLFLDSVRRVIWNQRFKMFHSRNPAYDGQVHTL